jgi:chemotaxis protein methyltransferase CheR
VSYVAAITPAPGETWSMAGELTRADFAAVAAIVQADARIHLAESKATLVHSRLSRRLRTHGMTRFTDYLALVERDAGERASLVEALTTNHTHFFREQHHFDHLEAVALPLMREKARREPVRIWSAGSSSGEEAYTIAMTLLGRDAGWAQDGRLLLLATDLSPAMVVATAAARYPAAAAKAIPAASRTRWTQPHADGFEIAPELRALVTARVLNLFDPWPMRRQFDAIFCRNVMIYFDKTAQAELEARLVDQLLPGGFLYIGHSERLVGPARAQMESCGQTIYRKLDGRLA